ncbi:hypothetical protein AURDEDRAFT_169994 [Auricularia subglabra TFB-10046 SS5]|uniref:Uncharacterized protein n=1 Tax=Auricularia subglabra (strain TFB-10046 / SS5) TaxID=717982 RepID=J0DD54_AURST|nr:hypothetical protein AURDEDRAFT_169994 [Auricularia subglabra TFB-10046 SS5]
MPPKLLASSPKTRRQRAALTRQLRSRTSTGSSSSIAPSSAKAKKTAPALKKAIPLCKTCTAGGRAVYHYWTQCPKKKEKTSASGKASQGKKSARTLATDARQAALLAELSDVTAELATRPDDAMSVDSDDTTSDAPNTDSQDEGRASDVSMAGGVRDEADASASDGDEPAPSAPVRMSDFFSDADDGSDSEPARHAALAQAVEDNDIEDDDDENTSATSDAGDESDNDDDGTSAVDSSDGDGASAASADKSDGAAGDYASMSPMGWGVPEMSVADFLAYTSDGTDVGGDESGPEEHANDSDDEDASHPGSDEDKDDAASDDARAGDADGAEEVESAQEDDSDDATTDCEGAVDTPNGEYFNQAAHVGRIDSDDDMDSETRIAKLHQAVEDKGVSQRAIELHQEVENPSPEKVQEQKALLAEATGATPPPVPADGDAASNRRAALCAMLAQSVDQREALEAGSGGSSVIMNGWKGNSAGGESIVYKRNTAQRWARVNKTHKTLKHDFKPMMQSIVQKAEYLSDCLGASVMVIAMPKGGLGSAHTWHSDQIEVDAPELPQAMRDLWFQQLAGARRQHVTEMAAALEALRAEQKATRDELIELNREKDKLKKRLDKTTAKLLREREARL